MNPRHEAPPRLAWSWQPARHGRPARSRGSTGHPVLRRTRSVVIDLVIVAVFVWLWLIVFTRGDVLWL
ncbi:MAG TPA: hypothetical protein VFZ32_05265 [Micromonosporaceae bacterium]